MASILVPVDFSVASHNAYHYALHLAHHLKLDLILAHYYGPGISTSAPLVIDEDGSTHRDYTERLRAFSHPVGFGVDYPLVEPPAGVSIFYETDVALANSATIIERANQSDIRFVVMATRSTKRFMGNWLGSTSTTVSESCQRPVFLIPPDVPFTPFNRLVVANNHQTARPYPLWQLEGLADIFGGKLHFVHVGEPDQEQVQRFVPWRLMDEFATDLRDHQSPFPFEVVTVDDQDVSFGLLRYAEEISADLVVVVNQQRSRWKSLLRKSLAQDVALRSDRPVLVLHTDSTQFTRLAASSYTKDTNPEN